MVEELLLPITSIIDFLFLSLTFWLGLYIITRSPKKVISWLAGGILWTVGGYFLSSMVYIHAPPESRVLPWWWGWSITIAVAIWFHLSVSLLARTLTWKWQWFVVLVYFLNLNFVAMQTYTNLVYEDTVLDLPITNDVFVPGSLYPFFSLFLIFILSISLFILWHVRRMSKGALLQRQILIFFAATCLAILGFVYKFLSIGYSLATPVWPGDLCLGLGVVLLGYGVIQINALHEGRVIGRDFLFSFIATGLVVIAYLLAAFFSRVTLGIPFVAFIFIIILAITSHSLVDWGRERLEWYFYRSKAHPKLRQELREFTRTTTSDHDVQERLSTLLISLCQSFNVSGGFISLREKDEMILVVSWKGDELGKYLDVKDLWRDEIQVLTPQKDVSKGDQPSVIIPLVAGSEQMGVIVLGNRTPAAIFDEDDFVILEDFADTVAGVIHGIRVQEEKLQQIQSLMEEVHEKERDLQSRMRSVLVADELHPFLNLKKESDAISEVEDALRQLNDFAYLGTHSLANLSVIRNYLEIEGETVITHLDRARALHKLLIACIDKLKPLSLMPSPPSKEWHQYVILYDCYVDGRLNRDVMGKLYIGEGTFNRARRRAVRAITRVLAEMEGNSLDSNWPD